MIEFLIALFIGLLAVLGGLLCIGFLLVEPLRNPHGQTVPINITDDICEFSKTTIIIVKSYDNYPLEDCTNILAR